MPATKVEFESKLTATGCSITQVPVAQFQTYLLPPLRPGIDVDRIVRRLQRGSKSSGAIIKHGRWLGFEQDPDKSSVPEEDVLDNLTDVVRAVANAGADSGGLPLLDIHLPKNSEDRCSQANEKFPEAYLKLRGVSCSERFWSSVGVPIGLSQGSNDQKVSVTARFFPTPLF